MTLVYGQYKLDVSYLFVSKKNISLRLVQFAVLAAQRDADVAFETEGRAVLGLPSVKARLAGEFHSLASSLAFIL